MQLIGTLIQRSFIGSNPTLQKNVRQEENNKSFNLTVEKRDYQAEFAHRKENNLFPKPKKYMRSRRYVLFDPSFRDHDEDTFSHEVRSIRNIERLVYNELLSFWTRYNGCVFPTHGYLADKFECSPGWILKVLHKLRERGLISWDGLHRHANRYAINPLIFKGSLAFRFAPLFKCLFFFAITNMLIGSQQYRPETSNGLLSKFNFIYTPHSKESGMGGNPISEAIRGVKNLNLSKYGQIELTPFPDEAIVYADEQLGYANNVIDPFKWFVSMCIDYCKREGIEPLWGKKTFLKQQFPYGATARMVLPSKPIPINQSVARAPHADTPALRDYSRIPQSQYQQSSVPTRTEREASLERRNRKEREGTQDYQFRRWTEKYEKAVYENPVLAHALQHMICDLDLIDPALREEYRCDLQECEFMIESQQ